MTDAVLKLKITADGSGVVPAVQGAESAIKRLEDQSRSAASEASRLNDATKRISEGFTGLRESGERLRSILEGLGVAFGMRAILEQADNLKRLSSEFGLTTSAIQEFRYIANITGQDIDKLLNSMRKQSTLITEAAAGNKQAAEAMNKLGLSAKALKDLDLDQQTELIGRAILNLGTVTEQTAAATTAWGKSATGMLAIMREQNGSLEQAREDAHKYGQVLSEDAINKLDDLGDSLKTAGIAWLNWASESGSAVGIVIDWLKELATWPPKIKRMWEDMWTSIQTDQQQDYADKLTQQNNRYIEELNRRKQAIRDSMGDEESIFAMGPEKQAGYEKQIAAIDELIRKRAEDSKSALDSVGAIKKAADAQAEMAQWIEWIDADMRQEELAAINYGKGFNDIKEATDKAKEAAENFLSQLDAEIELLKANYDESFRLTAIRHKVAESDLDAAVAKQKYIEDLKLEKKFSEDLQKVNQDQVKSLQTLDDEIARQKDLIYLTNEQRQIENRLAQAGLTSGTADYENRKKQLEAIQQQSHEMDLMKDIAGGVRDAWSSAFETIFEKGKAGFADLVASIKAWFIKMLAELAAMALARPVLVPILTAAGGMLGMSSANAASAANSIVGGMMPYGNLLGMGAQASGINPMQYVASLFPGTGGAAGVGAFGAYAPYQGLSGFSTGFTPAASPTSMFGSVLGIAGAGLGGWGLGGMAAGWYGGNTLGGNIGGALGGMGGMFAGPAIAGALGFGGGAATGAIAGSVVPVVGTIVGAILGGLLGGLFGGDKEPNHFRVSLGTNKSFPYRGTIQGYEDYSSVQGPFGDIGYILRGNNDAFDAAAESSKKFLEGIQQIDTAFAQFLNPQEVAAVKDRLKNLAEVEFTDTFSGIEAIKQRMSAMLEAVDPGLARLYQGLDITADNAGSVAVGLVGLRKEFGSLDAQIKSLTGGNNPVQQFLDQIDALDAAMMSAAQAGQEALAAGDPAKLLTAEQSLRQAITARYQYEMDAATQLNGVIEGLKSNIAGLKAQGYQISTGRYQDWLDINSRINATGGGGVAQLSIYRQAGASLLGAYAGETDPARRLEMLKQGMAYVDQGLAIALSDIDQWVQDQQAGRQAQIASINDEKSAIQAAGQARIDSLNQELQLTQQWASILSQAQSAIDQLQYGGQNPLSAFARLGFARSDLASETDPTRRIQLLQTLMGLGGEAYQRPSAQYGAIYNEAISGMTGLRDEAARQADRAVQIQEQIAAANESMQASLSNIDKQTAALQGMGDIQAQAAEMQAQARSEANTYYQLIQTEGAKTYDELAAANAEQTKAAQDALGIAQGQMDALTAGLGYQAFMSARQAEMASLLTQIRDVLAGIYGGRVSPTQIAQVTPDQIRALIPYIRSQLKVA